MTTFHKHCNKQQSHCIPASFNFNRVETNLKRKKKIQSQIFEKNTNIKKLSDRKRQQISKLLHCWFNNKRPDIQPAT